MVDFRSEASQALEAKAAAFQASEVKEAIHLQVLEDSEEEECQVFLSNLKRVSRNFVRIVDIYHVLMFSWHFFLLIIRG